MFLRGSLVLFCLITVVAGRRNVRGFMVDRIMKKAAELSAPKLAVISVPDVDTYLNYSGRIGANLSTRNVTLHGLENIKIKTLKTDFFRPAIRRISASCVALLLEGNYAIKGTSYGAFQGPLDASGPFTILLKVITVDFGATLGFSDFPKIKIKDIFLLDVFVLDSNVDLKNFFEDPEKQASFNKYLSELLPHLINDDVQQYKEPIKNLINSKLLLK